ncbi:nucleolar transcription factor 1-like isoform X2 [Dreissena polymorpha]|uniref:nucleolar transcription factor 1-like isoform X2 n=1 Tax=Dreissena polymorpha TaxID=45954 RepID=UPI002264F178|nr:nucleolar transcription factor 1-like isoform X2 [Dreissena polymorpha]
MLMERSFRNFKRGMTNCLKNISHIWNPAQRNTMREECQRNGTEFKPPRGRRKVQDRDLGKGKNSVKDADDEGDMSETDSLSDLHPAGQPTDDEEDEDEEDEDEEDEDEEDKDEEDDENKAVDSSLEDSDFEFEDLGNTEENSLKMKADNSQTDGKNTNTNLQENDSVTNSGPKRVKKGDNKKNKWHKRQKKA